MSGYRLRQRLLMRRLPEASKHILACLVTGLYLAGCASTETLSAKTPPDNVPTAGLNAPETARTPAPAPPVADAHIRQIDDHYAKTAAETRQRIQEALNAIKQAPTAAEVAALKATITRLEAQVTRLTAGTTRTEGALTGLTTRIETVERAQAERTPKEPAATSPPPSGALQKTERPEMRVDPADGGFDEALAALNGPTKATEPIRRWVELHPTHPKAAEGYFQLGLYFLNRNYPVAATYYFKRIQADWPLSLQAKETQAILANVPAPRAPAPQTLPKKPTTAAKRAGQERTPTTKSPVAMPNDDRDLPQAKGPTPKTGEAMLEGERRTPSAPTLSTAPSPVTPPAVSRTMNGPVSAPLIAPPPTGAPRQPAPPTRSHVEEKS